MKNTIDLIGRLTLSINFLYEAYDSIFYYQATKAKMAQYGLTWHPDFWLGASIFLLIFGGVLLLTGYRARLGAVMLLLYWLPINFTAHAFWLFPPETSRVESILFMRNMAIAGGLLMVWANGVGNYSIKKLFATTKVRGA